MAIIVFVIALTTHKDAIQSSNQIPTVILDHAIFKLYLLATVELPLSAVPHSESTALFS